jgi:FkbM family methyltransferase
MRVAPRDRGLFYDDFEPAVDRRLKALLTPGRSFADVGAFVGLHGVVGAYRVGPQGSVFLFEPDRQVLPVLYRTVALNTEGTAPMSIEQLAIGDTRGTVRFEALGNSGGFVNAASQAAAGKYSVPMTTLSDFFLERQTAPDVVLVDVEGFELQVLKGMEALWKTHPSMRAIVEMHPMFWERMGTTRQAFEGVLDRMGLSMTPISDQRDLWTEYGHVELQHALPA